MQVEALKLPDAPPLLQLTVPAGVTVVPPLLSVTVAVQVAPALTRSGFRLQLTLVVVPRRLNEIVAVPLLPMWFASPG